jgi:hypothetical protein
MYDDNDKEFLEKEYFILYSTSKDVLRNCPDKVKLYIDTNVSDLDDLAILNVVIQSFKTYNTNFYNIVDGFHVGFESILSNMSRQYRNSRHPIEKMKDKAIDLFKKMNDINLCTNRTLRYNK